MNGFDVLAAIGLLCLLGMAVCVIGVIVEAMSRAGRERMEKIKQERSKEAP